MHPPELTQISDDALQATRGLAGVQYADVRAVREDSESVNVRDERVEGVERGTSQGVGIRVLVDGAWGFAASSDCAPATLQATAQRAVEIARAGSTVRGDYSVLLDDTPPVEGSYVTPHERDPLDVPLAEKIDHLLEAVATAREAPGLSWAEASAVCWRRHTSFRSTQGARINQTVVQVGGGVESYAIGGGEAQKRSYPNSFGGQFVTGGWESVLALDLTGHALGCGTEAVALLDAPDLPYREDAVLLLGSSQLALQVHESIGHATELDRIMGMERAFAGTSFVKVSDQGTLKYGSPLVSVTADATTPGALGTFGYDDEGVPANTSPIIADGVLVGFLSNRETAGAIDSRSNGTARADSWGTIPLVRMNNVSLHPGPDHDVGLEELVADTTEGVLLQTNYSWSIDDRRDNFQFGCEVAYDICNGQRGRLYRNGTYAGRCLDFWRSCDALGGRDDWTVWGIPNCGKGQPGQVARVAHGASTGRFRATVGVH